MGVRDEVKITSRNSQKVQVKVDKPLLIPIG